METGKRTSWDDVHGFDGDVEGLVQHVDYISLSDVLRHKRTAMPLASSTFRPSAMNWEGEGITY